jgi:hypothetical protein
MDGMGVLRVISGWVSSLVRLALERLDLLWAARPPLSPLDRLFSLVLVVPVPSRATLFRSSLVLGQCPRSVSCAEVQLAQRHSARHPGATPGEEREGKRARGCDKRTQCKLKACCFKKPVVQNNRVCTQAGGSGMVRAGCRLVCHTPLAGRFLNQRSSFGGVATLVSRSDLSAS